MIRRSFQDFLKSPFIPLHGALVHPHLEYGVSACSPNRVADINHLERIQRLATRLVTGIRHFAYKERLQRLDLHFLQRWRPRVDAFKIFTGLLDVDPYLFFLPPARRRLSGLPYKVYWNVTHRRSWGLWNTGISSRLPSLQLFLSMFSRNGWRKFGQKPFHISPHPTCSYHLYMLPSSLFYTCGILRPVVAYFLLL